ncbi:MAG: hypothetical protein H6829_13305 [Planctomycetes bacterium]|nr:hypothetical protein [Planctomycetota bacterium]MCB9911982.1 hypothetical protein [Planctomycetota bacterium]
MEPHSTAQAGGLRLRVQIPGEASYEGSLIQFTGGTLTAHFWGQDLPNLHLAQTLEIQLHGLSVRLPSLPASPLERSELPGGRSYRFGYTLTPEFQSRIPKALQGLFPYRTLHRVRPGDASPIVALVSSLEGKDWHEAVVHDVSTAGLGLSVSRETEQQLFAQDRILVELRFPSQSPTASSRLIAHVQHRRLTGPNVRYGLALDPSAQGNWADHEALGTYIIERERQGA